MLTVFGNLRINDPPRLQHLKDSFASFSQISDNWVINIRGNCREEAMAFLKKNLGSRLTLFNLTNDDRGWSTNALEMLPQIKNDYILVWNEDHINLAPQKIYGNVVRELKKEGVDSIWYSWWLFGKSRQAYNLLPLKKLKHIDSVLLTKERWRHINRPGYPFYIISYMSIFKVEFFVKLLKMDSEMFPFAWTKKLFSILDFFSLGRMGISKEGAFLKINKHFSFRFRKFPEETPFNLEKEQYRTDILPIKIALSKRELFACIEDDLQEPGYSLVSRGLYKSKTTVKNRG